MGRQQRGLLALILVLVIAAVVIITTIPIRLGLDLQGGSQLTLQIKPTDAATKIEPADLEALEKVVEGRINGLGVSEAIVQTVGSNQLVVQLPGVNDPEQAERVLGGTAQLDFRREKQFDLKDPKQADLKLQTQTQIGIKQQERQQLLAQQQDFKKATDSAAIAEQRDRLKDAIKKKNQEIAELYSSLYERTDLSGKYLKNAFASDSQGRGWAVALRFDSRGAELFADLTKSIAGTGRTLGIFLDDALISAANVDAQYASTGIAGGNAEISGNFTAQKASELAVQLKGGSLPFPVEIVENRTVGATLGQDSVRSSIYAGVGGLLLVLVFMAVYYRLPGLIANVALLIYALLTLACFVLLGVTLTLPGIGGFILSIGMAVDANVLIFERMREELRAGKTLYRSVEAGFSRAWSSIQDSHVTTLISCAALFWLGAGLVKGFALTLALGLIVNLFTAITCSRTFLLFAISFPNLRKPHLFCPDLPTSSKIGEAAQ